MLGLSFSQLPYVAGCGCDTALQSWHFALSSTGSVWNENSTLTLLLWASPSLLLPKALYQNCRQLCEAASGGEWDIAQLVLQSGRPDGMLELSCWPSKHLSKRWQTLACFKELWRLGRMTVDRIGRYHPCRLFGSFSESWCFHLLHKLLTPSHCQHVRDTSHGSTFCPKELKCLHLQWM